MCIETHETYSSMEDLCLVATEAPTMIVEVLLSLLGFVVGVFTTYASMGARFVTGGQCVEHRSSCRAVGKAEGSVSDSRTKVMEERIRSLEEAIERLWKCSQVNNAGIVAIALKLGVNLPGGQA